MSPLFKVTVAVAALLVLGEACLVTIRCVVSAPPRALCTLSTVVMLHAVAACLAVVIVRCRDTTLTTIRTLADAVTTYGDDRAGDAHAAAIRVAASTGKSRLSMVD